MQKSVGECMSASRRLSQGALEGEDGDVVSMMVPVVKVGKVQRYRDV